MREFLKGLDLDSELIDTIMVEHGKLVTKDKEELQTLKAQIKELEESSKGAEELKTKYDELSKKVKEDEAEKKAKEEEKMLNDNIDALLDGKKFTSDYVRNGLINDIKEGLNKPENKGKGIKELFEELTKDKEGIFVNPNAPQDIPKVNEDVFTNVNKEAFNKMGYKERVMLKQENPELFQQLNE
jgi:hypothetical protein